MKHYADKMVQPYKNAPRYKKIPIDAAAVVFVSIMLWAFTGLLPGGQDPNAHVDWWKIPFYAAAIVMFAVWILMPHGED
jgi:hypothetical protein